MALYRRFLLIIAAVACAAGAVCGVITAKTNTERRLYGERKTLPAQEEQIMETETPTTRNSPAIPTWNRPALFPYFDPARILTANGGKPA